MYGHGRAFASIIFLIVLIRAAPVPLQATYTATRRFSTFRTVNNVAQQTEYDASVAVVNFSEPVFVKSLCVGAGVFSRPSASLPSVTVCLALILAPCGTFNITSTTVTCIDGSSASVVLSPMKGGESRTF